MEKGKSFSEKRSQKFDWTKQRKTTKIFRLLSLGHLMESCVGSFQSKRNKIVLTTKIGAEFVALIQSGHNHDEA
jgi:hypothetical protein